MTDIVKRYTCDACGKSTCVTDGDDDYSVGMRNGMRYVKYLIDGKEPKYDEVKNNEPEC